MEPQYERASRPGAARGGQHYYYADDDEDFSAEEIFNMFFGYGGMLNNHQIRYHRNTFKLLNNLTSFDNSGPSSRVYRHRRQGSPFHFTTNSTHHQAQAVHQLQTILFKKTNAILLSSI